MYLTRESYDFLRKCQLEVGDIIISNVGANAGTVFRPPHLDLPATLGPNAILVRPEGSKRFYYYYFLSPRGQTQLHSILSGSAA